MRRHPEVIGVQEKASGALATMTASDAEMNRIQAGSAGAVEALVAAMRRHSWSVNLQIFASMASMAMTSSSKADTNRVLARNAGAFETLAEAMRWHTWSA